MTDPIVTRLCTALQARSAVGIAKYGTTLARTDVDLRGWLQHAVEEASDLALYLTRAIEAEAERTAATERTNLALTIIAAELHRPGPRDTAVLRRLYRVLGGVAVSGKEGEG